MADFSTSPPFSDEIELAVLGGLMSANEALDQVAEVLNEDCFYLKKNKIIYNAIYDLAQSNQSHDFISVYEHIKALDQDSRKNKTKASVSLQKQIGGKAYLSEIIEQFDSYSNIKTYASILNRYRILRKLIAVGNQIAELGLNPGNQNAEELINEAEHLVFEIEKDNFNAGGIQSAKYLVEEVKRIYEEAKKIKGLPGVDTGYDDLNRLILGFQKGALYILAARPGVGKTSLALNIANNIAEKNIPVLIFSLEMTGTELMRRMVAANAQINTKDILMGNDLSGREISLFNKVAKICGELPIDIDQSGQLNPIEMVAKSRRIKKKHQEKGLNLGLIIVDYIQLMHVPWINENRVREVSEITRHLKILAKELQVPVLALSQLNRDIEKYYERGKRRSPRLSDLRDSGSIEQDADVIMFIDRVLARERKEETGNSDAHLQPPKNPKDEKSAKRNSTGRMGNLVHDSIEENAQKSIQSLLDPSQAFVDIAKNRHGAVGRIELYFKDKFTKFCNKEERSEQGVYGTGARYSDNSPPF